MEDTEDLNLNHKKFSPKTHQFQMSWWVFYFELEITLKIKWLRVHRPLSFLRKQESMSLELFWIPARVYPVLNTGRE
jgi:hypothetical protein